MILVTNKSKWIFLLLLFKNRLQRKSVDPSLVRLFYFIFDMSFILMTDLILFQLDTWSVHNFYSNLCSVFEIIAMLETFLSAWGWE